MRKIIHLLAAVGFTAFLGTTAEAAAAPVGGALPCSKTTIAARKAPTGPAQYESGSLRLTNGASMRLQGTKAQLNVAAGMAVGDPVAACYGPLRNWADAGPARTITVLDLANGAYYASLVGSWKTP